MRQDRRDSGLAEVRSLVTIDTMTVHDAEHPKSGHRRQITLNAVTVLVYFTHLRDEASARLNANLLNDFRGYRLWRWTIRR